MPGNNDEASIPTEDERNSERMSGVRRKFTSLLEYFSNPFSTVPPKPQDEDTAAAKRRRLQASTSISTAEDADTVVDAHTTNKLPASPNDTVAVAPTCAVPVAASSPSTGALSEYPMLSHVIAWLKIRFNLYYSCENHRGERRGRMMLEIFASKTLGCCDRPAARLERALGRVCVSPTRSFFRSQFCFIVVVVSVFEVRGSSFEVPHLLIVFLSTRLSAQFRNFGGYELLAAKPENTNPQKSINHRHKLHNGGYIQHETMMILPPAAYRFVFLTLLTLLLDHERSICEALMPQNISKRRNTSFTRRHNSPVNVPLYQRTLQLGSSNSIDLLSETTEHSQNLNINIPVLLETDHVLVINKPAGISHHDSDQELGILNVLRRHQEQGRLDLLNTSYSGRLYGVHRLDRVTSGILVFAKDAETARQLSLAFKHGLVTKYYTGISQHKPASKKQGWVAGGMVRGRRKSWQLTRETNSSSNNSSNGNINYAKTRFFTAGLGGLNDALANDNEVLQVQVQPKTLLLFRPYTGRTHQLRVAAKSVGLPLAGDPVYSDGFELENAKRTYLHATGFHLPANDETGTKAITIWSPPPFDHHLWNEAGRDDFQTIFTKLVHKHCDCPAILEILN